VVPHRLTVQRAHAGCGGRSRRRRRCSGEAEPLHHSARQHRSR